MTSIWLVDSDVFGDPCRGIVPHSDADLICRAGEAVAESAGILNVGIEGMMVIGAVTGFLVSFSTGGQWLGFAAAFLAGGAAGLMFGYVTVERGADHVVTGIVLNIFCFGLASLSLQRIVYPRKRGPGDQGHARLAYSVAQSNRFLWSGAVFADAGRLHRLRVGAGVLVSAVPNAVGVFASAQRAKTPPRRKALASTCGTSGWAPVPSAVRWLAPPAPRSRSSSLVCTSTT